MEGRRCKTSFSEQPQQRSHRPLHMTSTPGKQLDAGEVPDEETYWKMGLMEKRRHCFSSGQWHLRGPSPTQRSWHQHPQRGAGRRGVGKRSLFSRKVIGAAAVRSLLGRAQHFPRLKSGTEEDDKVHRQCTTMWSNVKAIWLRGAPAQPHSTEHCCNSRRKLPLRINAR